MSANQQLLAAGGLYDITPDPSIFGNQTDVALSTVITSNTVVPTGYTHATSWTCSGGTASINGGAYTTSGVISPGQSVTLRVTSSASHLTTSTVTFTVNGVASNWSVTTLAAIGQQLYNSPGGHSWVCPAGVTSVSVVCIGGGNGGGGDNSPTIQGAGGGLGYRNNIPVTPGQSYTVVVGAAGVGGLPGSAGGPGGTSYFKDTSTVLGGGGNIQSGKQAGGSFVGDGGGNGGARNSVGYVVGAGGAGGYSGNGGVGGSTEVFFNGASGSGGGGGGGGVSGDDQHGSGGGVGPYGEGASGVGGNTGTGQQAGGGSGGGAGSNTGGGGYYGGGGNKYSDYSYPGGGGCVRIIWPGNLRQFPSTRTADE